MRGFGYVISVILTVAGAIYTLVSLIFTLIIMSEVSSESDSFAEGLVLLLILFTMFYLPTFALFFFGHRIRKKLKRKNEAEAAAIAAAQYDPVYHAPPVQQRVETKTVINVVESRPAPAPKKAPTVSVECKGCGARKAVVKGESTSCDYCGSPLAATAQ
ncbi:ABC transporter ATP-binding protein [Paenibacillus sp. 1011MAR3C5]|uniref:ABC transporter ATP-binding protein n=1 Tax=Paenibacillus sp. 1011MAR3C5 TaxID=1675787 RepID=UPI000E6B50B0|nr:ABC transporter ATP-binding protein [Paenibacillus sp. 1011MAR3C5]RJE87705.1 ABC transporter ATP-binding protein [Paenibacillus sp. 1011MAR3C5]